MKRFVLFACFLMLITVLAAQPFVTNAQGPGGEEDFIPLILGDHVFSLLYPSTWTFDEEPAPTSGFLFTSDPSILTRPADQPFAPGEIVVSLDLLILSQPATTDDGFAPYLTDLLQQLLQQLSASQDSEVRPNFMRTTVNLMPALENMPAIAYVTCSTPDLSDCMAYLWRITDRVLGLVVVNTASGEIAVQEPNVLTLIQSVRFNTTPEDLIAAVQEQGSGS